VVIRFQRHPHGAPIVHFLVLLCEDLVLFIHVRQDVSNLCYCLVFIRSNVLGIFVVECGWYMTPPTTMRSECHAVRLIAGSRCVDWHGCWTVLLSSWLARRLRLISDVINLVEVYLFLQRSLVKIHAVCVLSFAVRIRHLRSVLFVTSIRRISTKIILHAKSYSIENCCF